MPVENLEVFVPGQIAILDVYFYAYEGGPLIEPDEAPTYIAYNPDMSVLSAGASTRIATGVYKAQFPIPELATISNEYRIIWTVLLEGFEFQNQEFFSVEQVTSQQDLGSPIIISDFWLAQIKKVLAYPDVPTASLSNTNIEVLCLWPALHRYFMKFPEQTREQYTINGQLSLDFPTPETYGVKDHRVVQKGATDGSRSSAGYIDFLRLANYNKGYRGRRSSLYGRGFYNTPYDFNQLYAAHRTQQQFINAEENLNTFRYYVNHKDRKLEAYSSIPAELFVVWAAYSTNFEVVKYTRQFEVIKLAQAQLLYHLADSASIVESNADQSINADALKDRAEKLETSVLEKWEEEPDPVIVR